MLDTVTPKKAECELELYRECPLCGSTDIGNDKAANCSGHALWQAGLPRWLYWVRCGSCAHSFRNGTLREDGERLLFSRAQQSQTPGHDVEHGRAVAALMVERVVDILGGPTRHGWTDIGFGAGHLLTTAEEYGFAVYGCDAREAATKPLAALGYKVECKCAADYLAHGFHGGSVVSMLDILEHVRDPKSLLRAAHSALAPSGLLVLSMPNAGSFAWRALDIANANPYWGELEHYHNFTRDSLYELLRATGFEPIRYSVSKRYRVCMEVIARKIPHVSS